MTATLEPTPERTLPPELLEKPTDELWAMLCRSDPGIWAWQRLGFSNAPFHWEWYKFMLTERRLAVVAPRDHAKSEVFTVNQSAWRSIYYPGTWTYVFANTGDQSKELKDRIDAAVRAAAPDLVVGATTRTSHQSVYGNGSRITASSSFSAVRGAHPDIIIGDDVLEEKTCLTDYQRKKTARWWKGTVSGMAHPGTVRLLPGGRKVRMAATRVYLVGTPFHQDDLLMSMRSNDLYKFVRYAAEYDRTVPGYHAVEIA